MRSLILVSKYSVFGLYNQSMWIVFSLHVLIFLVNFLDYILDIVSYYSSSEFCFILRRLLSHCCGNNRQAGWTQTTNCLLGGPLNLSSVLLSLAEFLGCCTPHTLDPEVSQSSEQGLYLAAVGAQTSVICFFKSEIPQVSFGNLS